MTKRILTKVLAVAIVMIMMLGVCAPVASAAWVHHDHEHTKDEINYVSLGDSMTNGYGLPGYDGNTGLEDYGDGSYANLFAEWLEETYGITVDHAQLAMSGMRAEDLHWLLELDYTDDEAIAITDGEWDEDAWNSKFTTGDYWTWNELCDDYRFAVAANTIVNGDPLGKITDKEAAIVAEYYQDAVANADVISLGMGNGNFGVFMFGRLLAAIEFDGTPEEVMIYDVDRALAELDPSLRGEVNTLLAKVEDKVDAYLAGVLADADQVAAVRNIALYTVISYVLNYIGSVEAILELNPDAEIILVGLMNTLDSSATSAEGITMGDLLNAIYTPLNAFIAALPAYMQATNNKVYDDATFYYAEAPEVECLVKTFGDDFYKLDGTPNVNSVIRQRFVSNIVGTEEDPGMVWNILAGTEVSGVEIVYVPYDIILECDYASRFDKEALAAAYAEAAADGDDELLSVLVSCAVYLAFENALLAAAEEDVPVTIDSIMGLGGISSELFEGVLDEFEGNVDAAGEQYEDIAADAITDVAKDKAAVEALDKLADEGVDIFTTDDIKALIDGTKTVADFDSKIDTMITEELDSKTEEIKEAIVDEILEELATDAEIIEKLEVTGHANVEELLACDLLDHATVCGVAQDDFEEACVDAYPEAYETAFNEAKETAVTKINDAIVEIRNAIDDAVEEGTSSICTALALPDVLGESLQNDETVNGLLGLLARFVLGDGVGSHPSEDGHEALFEAIAKSYYDGYTAKDETVANLNALANLAYTKVYAELKAAGKIDALQAYINKADALLVRGSNALASYQVDAEFANLKALLHEEIIDTRTTLAAINELLNCEVLDADTWAQIVALKGELKTHLSNVKAIAAEIKFVVEPYIEAAVDVVENYVVLVEEIIAEAYDTLENYVVEFKVAYLAFVDKAGVLADKISPEIGTAVRKFLIDSPKDALAIVYAYGEDAILKFAVDAAAAAGDVYSAVSALAALLEEHGKDIYYAVKATPEYREAAKEAKDLIAEIKLLVAEAKNAPASTALAYKQHIAELKSDLKALYVELYDLAYAAVAELKPGVAEMLDDSLETLVNSINIIVDAGEEYGVWFVGHTYAMMGEIFAALMENTEELLGVAVPEFKAIIIKALSDIDALIDRLLDEIKLELKDKIAELEQLIADLKEKLKDEMSEELKALLAALEAKLAELKAMLIQGVRDQIANILNSLDEIKAQLIEFIKAMIDGGFEAFIADLKAFVLELNGVLDKLMGMTYDEIKAAIKDIVNDALDYLVENVGPQIDENLKDEALYFDYTISEDSYYLAIGDFAKADGSYAQLLAEALGGINGMTLNNSELRVSDLLALIDATYVNDAYGAKFEELNAAKREEVIAEIAKADLITVDFGTADFTNFGINQIVRGVIDDLEGIQAIVDAIDPSILESYVAYEMDWARFGMISSILDVDQVLAKVKAVLVENGIPETYEVQIPDLELTVTISVADIVTYAIEVYLYTAANYVYNYAATIEAIHEINPDVEVVLIGSYNILEGLVISLDGMDPIDLTEIGEIFTKALNVHAFANAVVLPNTTYVGVEDARADAGAIVLKDLVNVNTETFELSLNTEAFGLTAEGNAYVAAQILEAMNITCEHIWDGCEDAECNYCGETRVAGTHAYDDCLDTECNKCGELREAPGHKKNYCTDTVCSVCGAVLEAGQHEYDKDCTDADCNVCGAIRTAQTEHSYTDCEDTSCNNEGCEVTREALEHEFDDCEDTECNNCSYRRASRGHRFEDCADSTCEDCSYVRVAPGHQYDDDCEDTVCNVCGAVRAAQEHKYEDCEDITCANCSKTRVAPGHTWGEWETTKAPTFDEAGEKQRTCSVCGKVQTEAIAKLVAEDEDDDKDDDKTSSGVKETEPVDDGGDDGEEKGLSGGAIAGISIGAILILGAGGFAIFWFVIKKNTWASLVAIVKGFFKKKG